MSLMRRRFRFLLMLLLCFVVCGAAFAQENLLVNSSFETTDGNGMPDGWYTEQWFTQEGYTVYQTVDEGQDGGKSVVITNLGANDARFVQSVSVAPESLYCLSGYIRSNGVSDAGWGANLSISGVYSATEGVYDATDEWRYVELYGETGEDQTQLAVYVRLGGYSGESEGSAQFDNIQLCKVDHLPDDVVADLWFRPAARPAVEEETTPAAAPFWPWLITLSFVYGLFVFALFRMANKQWMQSAKLVSWLMGAGLLLAYLLRYWLAAGIDGYGVDVSCFLSWGDTMRVVGPQGFYEQVNFCDYPPAYVYIMGLCSQVSALLTNLLGGNVPELIRSTVVFKILPMLSDLAIAWCVGCFAKEQGMTPGKRLALVLAVAFNPVLVINSAAWCQIDSVLTLLVVLIAWQSIRRHWRVVMPLFMLAVLVKPQALMLGPLGLLAILLAWVRHPEDRKPMLLGVCGAVLTALVIVLPFWGKQDPLWLVNLYGQTLSSYAYATVNTANLYYLVGANWSAVENIAHWAVPFVLMLLSLLWGGYTFWKLKKHPASLVEPLMMLAFTVFFGLCLLMHASWSLVGYGAMALAFVIVLSLYIRSGKLSSLPLLGGVLFLLLYVLGIKMHERYLFPGLILLFMAWVVQPKRRILLLMVLASSTVFINEGIVLDNSLRLGSAMGHLNADTEVLACILSGINVFLVLLGLWNAGELCLGEDIAWIQWANQRLMFVREEKAASLEHYHPDHRLHWRKLDTLLVTAITLVYAVVAFWHLGSTKAPQTVWSSSTPDEAIVLDLGDEYTDFSMLYWGQVSYSDFTVEVSKDGEHWSEPYWAQMAQGLCYRWQYLAPSYENGTGHSFASPSQYDEVQFLSGRYVRITAQQIGLKLGEVVFRSTIKTEGGEGIISYTPGATIPARVVGRTGENQVSPNYSDPKALTDEMDCLDGEPSWYTGTYFDEIYHARTAYEHLHGETAYETTHPPLGKVLMSWGIALFGMTPFGWRFAGALAGVLMLPGMYLLAKQLTKRTSLAASAALLLALDSMHYAQTRIATIDSFPVLFIIWAFFFMARFMQRDLLAVPVKKLLPDLALCGLMMGCAIASKWIGIYAGAGLAVLYFWTCARHLRLATQARKQLHTNHSVGEEAEKLRYRDENTLHRVFVLCLWCVLFFVAVPLVIYLLSYIPQIAPKHPTGLLDYLRKVWDAQTYMLGYHATPGLGMDHPFYSPWYQWPVNGKPMYYAMSYFAPQGQSFSIFCFSNPAVTGAGLVGTLLMVIWWLKRHIYRANGLEKLLHPFAASWDIAPAFVLIGLLAQYLPWVLVPRGTYIYHYFASIPFLILAVVVAFNQAMKRYPKAAKASLVLILVLTLACFLVLFPYASGWTVSTSWLDVGKQLLNVYYR